MASLLRANIKLAFLGSVILVSGCSMLPGVDRENTPPTPPMIGANTGATSTARRQKLRFGYEVANARQKFLQARQPKEDTTLDTSVASTTQTTGDPAQLAGNHGVPVYPQTSPNSINFPAQMPPTVIPNQNETPMLSYPQTLSGTAPYAAPSPSSTVQRLPDVQHAMFEK